MNPLVDVKPRKFSGFKKLAIFGVVSGVIAGAFAFSPTRVLTAVTSEQGVKISKDVYYGTDSRQALDIYQPDQANAKSPTGHGLPVVIFIHGGSWQKGDKEGYGFVGRSLAQAGYVTGVIEYRLAPKNIYPDYVNDSVSAISWVYQHIDQYGGNPNALFVMGHSAGAFNAVAAVDDERYWKNSHVPTSAIKAVIGLAGPYSYDFRKFDSKIAFPLDLLPEDVMPDSHVRSDAPPHYLLTAENDNLVGIKNLLKMKRGLERANVPVETAVVPKVNHITMIIAMATPTQWLGNTRQMVLDYMARMV
ncbi:MAG: alpha/beta hydrolase [Aquirhabdus sp.]